MPQTSRPLVLKQCECNLFRRLAKNNVGSSTSRPHRLRHYSTCVANKFQSCSLSHILHAYDNRKCCEIMCCISSCLFRVKVKGKPNIATCAVHKDDVFIYNANSWLPLCVTIFLISTERRTFSVRQCLHVGD